MQTVPHIRRGAFRMALRVACQKILDGMEANSEVRTVRGWKLFLVLLRMMLFRPDRGGLVSRKKLEARVRQFRRSADEEAVRATRALSLVQMGALCSPTGVGKGKWGCSQTRLEDLPVPRSALSQEVRDTEPAELGPLVFLRARRGLPQGRQG